MRDAHRPERTTGQHERALLQSKGVLCSLEDPSVDLRGPSVGLKGLCFRLRRPPWECGASDGLKLPPFSLERIFYQLESVVF